jgi:C_GCAxxG_C_C family probable redox protein
MEKMTKTKVRERYRGLSRQELIDKAGELAGNFILNSWNCSQSNVSAIHELLEVDDCLVKVATSQAGGSVLQTLGTCGAVTGGTITLDYFFGRPTEYTSYTEYKQANVDREFETFAITTSFVDKFVNEFGSTICGVLTRKLLGRIYCFLDPDEIKKFHDAGGHTDPELCNIKFSSSVARWVMEILLEKGAVEL